MANSPRWKVYVDGTYVAACVYVEDAAAIVAMHGGGTIRDRHGRTVYVDGRDGDAGESYDAVARVVWSRVQA